NSSPARRKFHSVFDQVPKDLLKPGGVAVHVIVTRAQPKLEMQIFLPDVLETDFVGTLQRFVNRGDLKRELQFSFCDSSHIEEVVDQACFQFHISSDNFEWLAEFFFLWSARLQLANHCNHGSERVPQFVGKQGKELVLGGVGRNQFLPQTNVTGFVFDEEKNPLHRLLRILEAKQVNVDKVGHAGVIDQRLFNELKRRAEGKDLLNRIGRSEIDLLVACLADFFVRCEISE